MKPPTETPSEDHRRDRAVPVLDAFQGNYARVQYHYVQFLTEHLTDCARVFSGDLGMVLILAVLGQRHIEAQLPGTAEGSVALSKAMSASRISDVTGLPRETVRRKLDVLATRGWIEQCPDRSWRIAVSDGKTKVRNDLDGLNARGLRRLARLYSSLVPLAE